MLRRTFLFGAVAVSAAEQPHAGQLLIATTKSRDPELAKSVILLIHSDRQGAVGLMLNHPTDVRVSRAFPSAKSSSFLYKGGPVALGSNALLLSRARLKSATNLFGNVYLIADKVFIEATANQGAPSSVFRVYLGYTGWSGDQLRNEIESGLWRVITADASVIFDAHSESLWQRLIRK